MCELPTDVIVDILSRLPVKPLLKFRCVSKPWCALIDSPIFIKSHLNRSIETKTNRSIICRDCDLYSIDFDSLDHAILLDHPLKKIHGGEVMGSCDGLVGLCNNLYEEDGIFLWNPATRKHQKLPVTPIEFPGGSGICEFIVYGFGYDSVSDDYKLVRVVQFYEKDDDDSFDNEVKVYSLKSNTWRRVQDFPYYLPYKREHAMVVSGALHWLVSRRPESDKADKFIAAFDLGVEEYRLVPLPELLDKNVHMNVNDFGGCLTLLCNYFAVRVEVWVMEEYGVKESWTKLFSVTQPSMIRSFDYVRPLDYSRSGGEILLEQDGNILVWYDLERKTVKNVGIHGLDGLIESYICVASLVPLRGRGGDGEMDGKKDQLQMKKKMNRKMRGVQTGTLSKWKNKGAEGIRIID
ncbi:F-box protein CPR1-like isoform X2 [Cornus florida]|uniref:F-box protein CPR1-like isoform X2 n=1 Tax=Cornus florida TaxID=4283 RepID=UPI00289E0431|nr:F-box protein CPR1-like isoform X2 [Cornus florida]